MSIMDQLAAKARVRIYKPAPNSDDRSSLCGEIMQKDNGGENGAERHFFEVPAHQADYLKEAFRGYTVDEPFIPQDAPKPAAQLTEPPAAQSAATTFQCTKPGCNFVAKSEAGLQAHIRAHDE